MTMQVRRSMTEPMSSWSGDSRETRPSVSDKDNEIPRFQTKRTSNRTTIRGGREVSELTVKYSRHGEGAFPEAPAPAYQPEAGGRVHPGGKYAMRPIGNDGRIHRSESISEYLNP